jgi:phage protein D
VLGSDKARATLRIDAVGPATAPKKILGELLPRLNNRLTGSGTTIGNPAIRAGMVIGLDGVGDQFGGLYRVTQATHTIDNGGYRTAFEVRKEVWFGSLPLPKGAGGLVRIEGQTIGQRGS